MTIEEIRNSEEFATNPDGSERLCTCENCVRRFARRNNIEITAAEPEIVEMPEKMPMPQGFRENIYKTIAVARDGGMRELGYVKLLQQPFPGMGIELPQKFVLDDTPEFSFVEVEKVIVDGTSVSCTTIIVSAAWLELKIVEGPVKKYTGEVDSAGCPVRRDLSIENIEEFINRATASASESVRVFNIGEDEFPATGVGGDLQA